MAVSSNISLSGIELRMLSTFVAVADSGGFPGAQITLNVSASSISRSMSDLEGRLGVTLCQRGRSGFRLTDDGHAVYSACKKLFSAMDQFRGDVGALHGQMRGELSVATVDNWVTDEFEPLSRTIRDLKRAGGHVQFNLHSPASDEVEHVVLDGRAKIGVGVFHRHRPGLVYETLYTDPLDLYCGKDHPLYTDARKNAGRVDISNADYVRRGYLSEEQVAPLTANLSSSATAHQIEGIAFLILSGEYIGYLPKSYAKGWVDSAQMAPVHSRTYQLNTEIELLTKRGAHLTTVEQQFVDRIRANANRTVTS